MVRGRAFRRAAAKRWQRRRYNKWLDWGSDPKDWLGGLFPIGQLRKNHFGCGCRMCKPWKYKQLRSNNYEKWSVTKFAPNQYRKAQFYEDPEGE